MSGKGMAMSESDQSAGVRRLPDRADSRPGADRRNDRELVNAAIERARNGDMEGLYLLYVSYGEDVFRYVNSLVKDHHEAEDITQSVFLKLVTVLRTYEQRDVPFIAWVLRVARNLALDHMRDRRLIPCEELSTQVDDHRQIGDERRKDLCWALEQLPEEQRSVLILRHIHGFSPPEIADVLGKSESSIDGLHHRGRKSMQATLEDLGAAPVVAKRGPDRPVMS
jgi:RNA polymerase sigma-70 factor, ECF subfamily